MQKFSVLYGRAYEKYLKLKFHKNSQMEGFLKSGQIYFYGHVTILFSLMPCMWNGETRKRLSFSSIQDDE